jgi:hypothetical protein
VEVAAHGVVDEAAGRLDLPPGLVLEHHVLIPPAAAQQTRPGHTLCAERCAAACPVRWSPATPLGLTSSATWPLSPLTPQDHARQGQSGARGVMEAFRNTVLGVYQPPSACTAARSTHSQAFSTCCASNAAATDTPCQCPLPAASQMCQPPAAQHAPASSSPSHVFPARFSAHKATNLAQCKTKLDTSRTRTCA